MGFWSSLDHTGLLTQGHKEGDLEEASGSERSQAGPRHPPRVWEQQVTGQCHDSSCCDHADPAEGPPCGLSVGSCRASGRTPAPQSPRHEAKGEKGNRLRGGGHLPSLSAGREGGHGVGAPHLQLPHPRSSDRAPCPWRESRRAACPPPPSASSSLAARAPTCLG